jgi:hypothetical protein
LGGSEGSGNEVTYSFLYRFGLAKAPTRVSSLCRFGIVFRPKRRLDCPGSLMPEVGHDPGPIHDAALSPRQALLRFLELALGVTHTLTPGSVELWVCGHAESQT